MTTARLSEALVERPGTARDGSHSYVILGADDTAWVDVAAEAYRDLRTSTPFPLENISVNGIDIIDAAGLQARLVKTQLPERRPPGRTENLAVERSDLGEVLMAVLGEERHGYQYGYRSTRDRELVTLPGRSIDQIGVVETDDGLVLSLGEAKVSEAPACPPDVVDTKPDSLRNQHIGHLRDVERTAQKIFAAARHSTEPRTQALLMTAAFLWEQQRLDVLVVRCTSMLVRPEGSGEADFGTHRSQPADYAPGEVDFVIVHVPGGFRELITEFLAKARGEWNEQTNDDREGERSG